MSPVQVSKKQRKIEPEGHASYRSLNSDLADAKTFRPDQPHDYYDPKAEKRKKQKKWEEEGHYSKFETGENI